MALDYELARMFAKMTNDQGSRVSEATVQGTVKEYAGGMYVQLDGSDLLTPVSSTTGMKDGDRVNVMIKDHSATVTGNTTAPSATKNDTDIIQGQLDDTVDQISEFEIVLAGKVDTEVLNAQIARIDNLTADNVVIKESLSATEANIKDLQAENVAISGQLDAFEADIDNLHANMLTAEAADLKYATIENLEATDAKIYNLEGTYAEFEQTVTEKLTATDASIENLEATKLSAEEADLKYANIDFANIGKAAIEEFFSKSGMIGDLVVGEGTITGHLVGVTISGDLIEGNTIKADKLVVLGEDGLYYKLNVNAETVSGQQTEYNSINGSIITANTITAEKINVNDLVAFDATIGGFKITDSSIYSGVKESIDNTTRGIYMDDTGQLVFGDQSNYLKYFHDTTDDTWKLIISAGSIKLGSSQKDIETVIDETVTDKVSDEVSDVASDISTEYYKSTSATSLTGGSWTSTAPTWSEGSYIWTRTKTTKKDGTSTYSDAVCITGNTGDKGDKGDPGDKGDKGDPGDKGDKGDPGDNGTSVTVESTVTEYQTSTNGTTPPTGTWSTTIPSVSAGSYLWTRVTVTYSDDTVTTSYSVARQGEDGAPGDDGIDGVGIDSTVVTYQASSSQTETPTGEWLSTIPELSANTPYLWTRTVITYTDETSTTSYSVSSTINGIDVVDTVSGEGYVSIGENGGKKPYEIVIYGKTRQNLWTNPATRTWHGVTLTNNADGTITLDGTCTANVWITTGNVYNLKANTTYTLSLDKAVQNSGDAREGFYVEEYDADGAYLASYAIQPGNTSITFTMKSNASKAYCAFLAYTGAVLSGTYRVMLNEGTEAEPWCPPGLNSIESLDYISAGKNLLQPVDGMDGYDLSGVQVTRDNNMFSFHGTATKSGGRTIYFSKALLSPGKYTFGKFDAAPNVDVYLSEVSTGTNLCYTNGQTVLELTEAKEVGLGFNLVQGETSDYDGIRIQLERGESRTDYEPANVTQATTIPLQGYTLGSCPDGTRDELHIYRDGSRKLIKRTWRQTLTGTSASWIKYTPNTKWTTLSRSAMEKYVHKDCTDIGLASKASFGDVLPPSPGCWGNSTRGYAFTQSDYPINAKFIYINTPENDLELAKTWLTNNPLTVVYKLKDEIEINLDPIDLPEFNAESAIAIFDSGIPGLIPDVDVTYWTKLGATVADADSAASNAEDKIDNLDVGATNLALYTDRPKTYIQDGVNNWFDNKDTTDTYRFGPRTSDLGLSLLKKSGEFTVSFDWAAVNVPKAFEFYVALENGNEAYQVFGSTYTMPKQAAVSGHFVTTSVPSAEQMEWGRGFLFGGIGSGTNYPDFEITISNFKFEKGNKETTWSQAPEELASGEYVDDIEESLSSDIAGLEETISEAFINIDSINAKMEFLVTDENGNSMMTQTSDGWTFNMSSIQNTVDKAIEDIDTIHGDISSANKIINDTKNLVDDISQKTSYINLGQDESGSPCILLGDTASPFKLRITNTSIDFMEGSDKIAYVTNRQLYIQSSVVTDEMSVGSLDQNTGKFEGFVWKKRANGNMGLRWEG